MSNYRFITSCDNNETYLSFVPSWIKHHTKLFPESEIVLVLISDKLPENLKELSNNIILFKPIENIHTSYQAQMLRLLYPTLLSDKQNVICDIDMYILSKDVLTLFDRIPDNDNRYINFGCLDINSCHREKQLPLFFSIYGLNVLQNVFKVKDMLDILILLKERYKKLDNPYGYNWFSDQELLYELFINYKHLYKIERTNDRVDRDWFNPSDPVIIKRIKTNCIVDFHAPRPYHKYKSFIQSVLMSVEFP
jgi:hypothetical protein